MFFNMKVVQRERGNINTHLRYMSDVYAKEVKKLEIRHCFYIFALSTMSGK